MSEPVRYVDTTLRDLAAHPWASGIDTQEIAGVTERLAESGAVALEALDSFSARGAIEGRLESPWERLRAIVRAAGPVPVGIVVSAGTLFGSRPASAELGRRLVAGACESGVRRVRLVDALNDVDALRPMAEETASRGAELVPTLVLGPAPEPDDQRWLDEARAIAGLPGATAVCVVDRAGHLPPAVLATLVPQIAEASGLPVELCLVGPGAVAPVATVAGVAAGAAAVQAAIGAAAMAATRPSVETLRAALEGSGRDITSDRAVVQEIAGMIWSLVPSDRLRQAQVAESGPVLGLPVDLAAGAYSRLVRLGLVDRRLELVDEVDRVAAETGNLTLVHPLGEAVVGQAVQHVAEGARWTSIDPTLVGAVRGRFGRLRGEVSAEVATAADAAPPLDPATEADLDAAPSRLSEEDKLLWVMFPQAAEALFERRDSLVGETTAGVMQVGVDRTLIETLVDVVEASSQAEVTVEVGGARVTVRRTGAVPMVPAMAAAAPAETPAGPTPTAAGLVRVESPIVGTFYAAPSPDADAFVKVGDRVSAGQTLCIIEAMKIFNEITADTDGVVRSIDVQNAEPVEYGTLLFTLEP